MKRVPLIVSFLLFIALCAAIAYWALQLFKPPTRPVAAPPRVARAEVSTDAAAALFGGRPGKAAVASNYQLKGVILSGAARDSVAILSADGKPAQAVSVGLEVVPGVTVKEVHREYVLLSEGGALKRVELPESAKAQVNLASAAPVGTQGAAALPPAAPPASSRGQMSPPPAPLQSIPAPNPATGSTQTANPRSPLLPPPAPQAQQQAQQQTPLQSQTAPAVPPTVVPAPSVQTQAVPAAQQSAAAPSIPAPPAAPARSIPEAAGTASEMLPPPALQSR